MTETAALRQDDKEDVSVPLPKPFRDLFDAEFGYVCRTLLRLGVRSGDVDDVAQELFLTVHRALPSFDASRPVRPWLCGFSVRFAANYRRLGRLSDATLDDVERKPAPVGSDLEARDLVLKILERLDFDRRTVVVMHDLEGFDAPEIARQLEVPLNTIYSRLRLAREDLKVAADHLQKSGGAS
jgi:RNA polymerase sigma-70 factor (ECF subfamily)